MNLKSYLTCIKNGQIPAEAPDGLTPGGYGWNTLGMEYYEARSECTRRGLWMVIAQDWTKNLAQWIGSRKVIEVMAGGGWLAKALAEQGIDIVATDDYTWDDRHKQMKRLYPVRKMTATRAAHLPGDILLVSWPPYGDKAICRACKVWGSNRPILYLGEDKGGCNAPDLFFQNFQPIEHPDFGLVSWDGIHDEIQIGYWRPAETG